MGTRAIITIDEKPFLATHFDGYPDDLGFELMHTKTISDIIGVAKKHIIDFADISLEDIRKERIAKIAKTHDISEENVINGVRKGCVLSCEEY